MRKILNFILNLHYSYEYLIEEVKENEIFVCRDCL